MKAGSDARHTQRACFPAVEESLRRLYRRNMHVIKLGLDETRALLAELENPQDGFLTIHVAGTNGKGSVCAMLASVLQQAGFRTGLYTSPHLIRFNERIRVDGEPIPDADLARLLDVVDDATASLREGGMRDATFFEFTTALAFARFRERAVQIAVVETGMGGRLDATNVVQPLLSVITPIGLDHQQYLGGTLEAIAGEKAGIIKPGRPVVAAAMDPAALAVLRRVAHERGAPFHPAGESVQVRRVRQTLAGQRLVVETEDEAIGPLVLPLLGPHQLANCATAVAALTVFRDVAGLPITAETMARGLSVVRWPARLQVVEQDPPVVVDGAHNPAAARALHAALHELAAGRPVALVAGFLSDKDAASILRELADGVRRLWLVTIEGERSMPLENMQAAARSACLEGAPAASLAVAVEAARVWARENNGLVCIAGSLYLAGEALRVLRVEL